MKKCLLIALALLLCCTAALAQTVPDDVIRAALLEADPLTGYPTCEMMAEWHQVLGEDADDDSAVVYVVAYTSAFGEVNGVFLGRGDEAVPAVMTFDRSGEDWTLTDIVCVADDSELDEYMPEDACEAYEDYDEDAAQEAIRREVKAWLKAAGRKLDVAVTYYDMDDDLDDVELPEDVWQLTVGWPVGYLDQLAECRYPLDGRMVACVTAWEPDEDDDELGLLSYTMTDAATGEVLQAIAILVTEDAAVITMEDAAGSRRYACTREDDAITDYVLETTGACGIDVEALELNLRIAMMDGIEAYN